MKRTISLIIAIAIMISMFVLPANAAEEYVVDMTTIPNTGSFPGAGINDVVGLHFLSGGTPDGRLSVFPLDLSGYNTMTITYRTAPEATTGVECATMRLRKSDYSADIGSFSIKGSGGWSVEAEASIDISAVTEKTTNYLFNLDTCDNGFWITGIKLTGEGTGSTDPVTPPATGNAITAPSQFVAGTTNVLSQNIEGVVTLSSGTYVIDLAGYKWTGRLFVSGTADVTIMDSSEGKTGLIDASQMGDAIDVSGSAKLTLDAVKVIGAVNDGDAIFVSGGTVVSNNSILTAGKAGIDVTSASASVTVNGGSFPEFTYGAKNERNSAIELRWNAKVTLIGDIDFTVNRIVARKTEGEDKKPCHTNAIDESIKIADSNATATFTDEVAVVNPYPNYNVTEITYTYTVPAADPAFAGASVTLSSGIALNFIAEGVDADDYIVVKGKEISGVPGTGEDAGMYIFTVDDFGPQAMGDDITAELYADGALVDELTYSVKDYCYDVIADNTKSEKHIAVAKAILNYGAAAQKYKNYKENALVNADLEDSDKNKTYVPNPYGTTIEQDSAIAAQYVWKTANVYFGVTNKLVITFKPTDSEEIDVTAAPAYIKYTTENGIAPDIRKDFEQIGDNLYQIVFDDLLPTDIDTNHYLGVFDENDNQLSWYLNYSLKSYINMNDGVNAAGEFSSVGLQEPEGPINELVQKLSIYCRAVKDYCRELN